MKRTILIFVSGMLLGGLLVGFYRLNLTHNQFKVGVITGEISAKIEILKEIQKRLGDDYVKQDGQDELFNAKDLSVMIVERNGIKTLRPYKPPIE